MDAPNTASPEPITEQQMQAYIARLKPDRELYAGRKFFERLLKERGVDGVLSFVAKASEALDKNDGLDLHYDFDKHETHIFRKTPVRVMSRRFFLGTVASNVSGAVFAATGLVGLAKQIRHAGEDAPSTPAEAPKQDWLDEGLDIAEAHTKKAYPTAELLIGAALLYEGSKNKFEDKLEQVSDAVEELRERIERAESQQGPSR